MPLSRAKDAASLSPGAQTLASASLIFAAYWGAYGLLRRSENLANIKYLTALWRGETV